MRSSQPIGVTQFSSHVASECAATCPCTNSVLAFGSMPQASSIAASERVCCTSVAGSCGTVIACRSTMQKKLTRSL